MKRVLIYMGLCVFMNTIQVTAQNSFFVSFETPFGQLQQRFTSRSDAEILEDFPDSLLTIQQTGLKVSYFFAENKLYRVVYRKAFDSSEPQQSARAACLDYFLATGSTHLDDFELYGNHYQLLFKGEVVYELAGPSTAEAASWLVMEARQVKNTPVLQLDYHEAMLLHRLQLIEESEQTAAR
ncbi:MAG: hypothetical protein AAGI38_05945 [Bacteroidota bacterium]